MDIIITKINEHSITIMEATDFPNFSKFANTQYKKEHAEEFLLVFDIATSKSRIWPEKDQKLSWSFFKKSKLGKLYVDAVQTKLNIKSEQTAKKIVEFYDNTVIPTFKIK